ncbi:MAG: NifU family protein [Armatimonadetes bacterium]|nr:NifU family protein [Armatimonadota bacterium]MBI2200747.1 NifU family protein [Armatimonadota bacterium]MBI2246332.1 NifU family protein [Armatimonadota bacterium]MBI2973363.1 NifU family protein [Armatimonadota bacterium]
MADQVQTQVAEPDVRAKVEQALDNIRPYIQGDGGDIELVDIVQGIVQIRLAGACVGCMHSMMTLQVGIERMLKEAVPEIVAVEAMPF